MHVGLPAKESGPEQSFLCAGPYWQTACKPNFVVDDHSSRPRITARAPQRPTREFGAPGQHAAVAEAATFPPIWSCSVWGLPCLRPYSRSGALLPHLFTLTLPLRARRFVFCGTSRPGALTLQSRTLSGTLPCGVRTFLPRRALRRTGSDRLARLPDTIVLQVNARLGISAWGNIEGGKH